MGSIFALLLPAITGTSTIMARSSKPINGEATLRHLSKFSDVALAGLPSVLEEIVASGEEAIKDLASRVKYISFGGAPLSVTAGDTLASYGINLVSVYGM